MKKAFSTWSLIALILILIPVAASARGTQYSIAWPEGHIGPVYVQIYDIRVNPPYERLEDFKVWVTWDKQTKCYVIGNRGVYTLKLYKYDYHKAPMIVSGNAASFKIRYSLCPPWI
jgi:hypothetical protein